MPASNWPNSMRAQFLCQRPCRDREFKSLREGCGLDNQSESGLIANCGHSTMRRFTAVLLGLTLVSAAALAQSSRFVIDDDEYLERITNASARLLQGGRLKSVDWLRSQLPAKRHAMKLAPVSSVKLAAPDLYDRLRESTLAVGSYYKCPDCGAWHFNSSAGFVAGEGGIVCTCWHVVAGEDSEVKESYLIAADSAGQVFPVQSVLAADTEADTCFLRIAAAGLKPLPLRANVRPGERVYCLSHPGGFHFMFSEGVVARVTRGRLDVLDEHGQPKLEAGRSRSVLSPVRAARRSWTKPRM
ncbi:MAG: hypothetical protein DME25_19030 [Verrucomicrobia bacterium]|nr:MAG: hypothetical protein DME25_19030 [Verrucomicrobiota bacterium]